MDQAECTIEKVMAFPLAELAKEVGNEVLAHCRGARPKLGCQVSC